MLPETEKMTRMLPPRRDMRRNALNGTANWQTRQSSNCVRSPHHVLTTISLDIKDLETVEDLSKVCSQIVMQCWNLTCIGRLNILWSVSKLARGVTKWTQACDRRLARLTSYIHHTMLSCGKYCTALQIGIVPRFWFCCGDLEDLKSTSGGVLCIFGRRTSVPISWICKKQTWVSNGSSESEAISSDASFRMDGKPALGFGYWRTTFFFKSTQSTEQLVAWWTLWQTLQRKNDERV